MLFRSATQPSRVIGWVITYVDDFLVCAPSAIAQALLDAVQKFWALDGIIMVGPGMPGVMHYCGADLIHTGISMCMSQERYIKDVLQRVGLKESNIASTPVDNNVFEQVAEETKKNKGMVPDKALVHEAQILVGCIIWVATRDRKSVV